MKKEVVLVLLLLIAAFAFMSFSNVFSNRESVDAKKFFEEDLSSNYPDADVREITNISKIGEGSMAYYVLKARVAYNLSTPCPERLEVEYNYPSRNFVNRAQKLVYGCRICLNPSKCVITYPEEAIIASHTYDNSERVAEFLKNYPNAKPAATLQPSYGGQPNIWQVDWSDDAAPYDLRVLISQPTNKIFEVQITNKGA